MINNLKQIVAKISDKVNYDYQNVYININNAFISALSGDDEALKYLQEIDDAQYLNVAQNYLQLLDLIQDEFKVQKSNPGLLKRFQATMEGLEVSDPFALWHIFFEEGALLKDDYRDNVDALRNARRLTVKETASPITDPSKEMIFTSNILLTIPAKGTDIDSLPYSAPFKEKLKNVTTEEQIYFYDHPIPIGIPIENNEIFYGLSHLDKAVAYEKDVLGNMGADDKLCCVLSVSVTHKGLAPISKEYIEEELANGESFDHLDIHIITEEETSSIVRNVLTKVDKNTCYDIIGVNGEYAVHYNFLKAVAPLWQVVADERIKAVFKIDLDQIIPQKELVEQGGSSFFSHFLSPLWGATCVDSTSSEYELGMIAGALVNEKDFHKGIFTPDVTYGGVEPKHDEAFFYSKLPQALSTEAEMMTRYEQDTEFDGKDSVIHRIHVTGGTNGSRVDSLKRYRPFCPSFIGRAEDQCYIMSTFKRGVKRLGYLHKPGLIMRHDKESFAAAAIKMAATGKTIGDYVRTIYFSNYAKVLPVPFDEVKRRLYPFTGCFISELPVSLSALRFAHKAIAIHESGDLDTLEDFVKSGSKRIVDAANFASKELQTAFNKERDAWNSFYDALEVIREGIKNDDEEIINIANSAKEILLGSRVQ